MFAYYIRLAFISLRKNLVLSSLMVAAVGLGIGLCMTIVAVNYMMAKDPIPQKSDVLYHVQLDSWSPNSPYSEPNEPPDQLTYLDAIALMDAKRAARQTASVKTSIVIESDDPEVRPFMVTGRATYSDFFAMFDVPFVHGGGWTAQADAASEQVVVITREINDRVFGGENSVGRNLAISGRVYRVVGVMDDWLPMPKFYDVTNGPFNLPEDVYMPFSLVRSVGLQRSGNTNCWKPVGQGTDAFYTSECIWIQMWVELYDADAVGEYRSFLDAYVTEQKTLGRFQRPLNNRLRNVNEWLDDRQVVDTAATMMLAVAIMFLAVCLLNTIGLLLAKFLGKAGEIGVRRALGASKSELFKQHMIESGCIGAVGGLLGLFFAWLGLQGIVYLFGDEAEPVVQMDWVLVVYAILLAVVSSLLAGMYPTWRACNVQPAHQLKTQ
jgi:putative ABC transport system permease protein